MEKVVRLGQIGLGYWGKNLYRNFVGLGDTHVSAVCDTNPAALQFARTLRPEVETHSSVASFLASEGMDAVVIATDTPQHFPLALEALRAGKHVFVEKPMARTVAEAAILVDEAKKRDLRLMVGHLLLYHPAFVYVRRLIESGELGKVYYLYGVRVNLGIVRNRENAFESLAPHDIAVALSFMNSRPVSVSAQGQSYLQSGIEDVAFAVVHFADGKMAHLHTSWLDPHKIRKVTVVGSRKMAVIDDVEGVEKVRLYDKGVDINPAEATFVDYASAMTIRSGDIRIPKIEMREPLLEECRHFVDCVRTGTTPLSDAENGLEVVRIMEAALQSMKNGGAQVPLD